MRKALGGQIGFDNLLKKNCNILQNKQIFANGRSALFFILKSLKKKNQQSVCTRLFV